MLSSRSSPPLARAIALDTAAPLTVRATLLGWVLIAGCSAAAIQGWLALHVAEKSFAEFGLEGFALGAVAKGAICRSGTGIAAGVLLAFAIGVLHFRGASFASARSRRWLALRIAGLLPVLALATTVCCIGSAVVVSNGMGSVGEFLGIADVGSAMVVLALQMVLVGAIILAASPLLTKKRGLTALVGKVASVWFVEGLLWLAVAQLL
jgi:hypothetical protein